MVFVSVSETYDLSTVTNKMTVIGIHTPDKALIQKTYPGLCMNTKYCRIVSQDVAIACASMEPADPLQIGTEAGAIAPEDMFNPILYKAVSNASMSQLEGRIHGLFYTGSASTPAINGHQAVVDNDEVTPLDDEFPVYYSLLSNRDGFKAASPQAGLQMKGLVPLVFEELTNVGTWSSSTGSSFDNYRAVSQVDDDSEGHASDFQVVNPAVQRMRGNAKPMPRFPTSIITSSGMSLLDTTQGTNYQFNGMADGKPTNAQIFMPDIPRCFTAAIVVPPSKLHRLFYRMIVRTHIEFSEVRPIQEIAGWWSLKDNYASDVYYSDYEDLSKRFDTKCTQVDVISADIKKVMEGS